VFQPLRQSLCTGWWMWISTMGRDKPGKPGSVTSLQRKNKPTWVLVTAYLWRIELKKLVSRKFEHVTGGPPEVIFFGVTGVTDFWSGILGIGKNFGTDTLSLAHLILCIELSSPRVSLTSCPPRHLDLAMNTWACHFQGQRLDDSWSFGCGRHVILGLLILLFIGAIGAIGAWFLLAWLWRPLRFLPRHSVQNGRIAYTQKLRSSQEAWPCIRFCDVEMVQHWGKSRCLMVFGSAKWVCLRLARFDTTHYWYITKWVSITSSHTISYHTVSWPNIFPRWVSYLPKMRMLDPSPVDHLIVTWTLLQRLLRKTHMAFTPDEQPSTVATMSAPHVMAEPTSNSGPRWITRATGRDPFARKASRCAPTGCLGQGTAMATAGGFLKCCAQLGIC